jgi:hypothetical protein
MRDAGRSRDSDGRPPECSSSPRVLIDIADTRSFPPLSNSCHALPEHADWIAFSPQLCNLPSLLSRQTGTKSLAQSREVFVYLYTTSIADSSSFNPRCAKLPQDLRCRWF